MYLHAIRLLKINTYDAVLISQIQMQMRAEIQALEGSPLKKKGNYKISFSTVSFIVEPFGKEVESKPSLQWPQ